MAFRDHLDAFFRYNMRHFVEIREMDRMMVDPISNAYYSSGFTTIREQNVFSCGFCRGPGRFSWPVT